MASLGHDACRDNEVTLSTVGGLFGKDKVAACRAFDVDDPPATLRALAALLLVDKAHTWIRGACRLVGGEFVERPRLTKEQKYDLLVETLRRHGKPGVAYLDEALGEDGP